jgi:hypothetical protein
MATPIVPNQFAVGKNRIIHKPTTATFSFETGHTTFKSINWGHAVLGMVVDDVAYLKLMGHISLTHRARRHEIDDPMAHPGKNLLESKPEAGRKLLLTPAEHHARVLVTGGVAQHGTRHVYGYRAHATGRQSAATISSQTACRSNWYVIPIVGFRSRWQPSSRSIQGVQRRRTKGHIRNAR